jgi:hypothetical protein
LPVPAAGPELIVRPARIGRPDPGSPPPAPFSRKYLRRLRFIMPIYLAWGIPAGTYGFLRYRSVRAFMSARTAVQVPMGI